MNFIAHRGYKLNSLENSIKSFKNAINDDYFVGFELDLRVSKDNKFVVIHDFIIDRVTNSSGLVKNKTAKELKKLGIPRLEDVLKLKHNKIILIEIKDYSLDIAKFVKLLNKYRKRKIYVMSFSKKVIKKILPFKRNFKIGVLNAVINSEKNYHDYDFIGLYKNILTNNLIEYFLKQNIEIFVWGLMDNINLGRDIIFKDELYLIVNKKL